MDEVKRERLRELRRVWSHDEDVLSMDDIFWLLLELEHAWDCIRDAQRESGYSRERLVKLRGELDAKVRAFDDLKFQIAAYKTLDGNKELFTNLAYQEKIDALKAELQTANNLLGVELEASEMLQAKVTFLEGERDALSEMYKEQIEKTYAFKVELDAALAREQKLVEALEAFTETAKKKRHVEIYYALINGLNLPESLTAEQALEEWRDSKAATEGREAREDVT